MFLLLCGLGLAIFQCTVAQPEQRRHLLLYNRMDSNATKLDFGSSRYRRGILLEPNDPTPAWEPLKTQPDPSVDATKKLGQGQNKVPCRPLPPELLRKILGAAFNPRYMAIRKPLEDAAGKSQASEAKSSSSGLNNDQPNSIKQNPVESFYVQPGFSRVFNLDGDEISGESVAPLDGFNKKASKLRKKKRRPRLKAKAKQLSKVNKQRSSSERFVDMMSRKRRSVQSGFPWECKSRVEWIDLGQHHFPRYLRTVVCTSTYCWFGHFQCRAKAFTVKILRRLKDSCTPSDSKDLWEGNISIPDTIEGDANEPQDVRLPPEFRDQWAFEERAVTFCCECAQ